MQYFKRQEVAFFDSNVAGLHSLIQGLKAGIDPVLLNSAESALGQIASYLRTEGDLEAIHIYAHGAPGQVDFAAGAISIDSIADSSAELTGIRQSMKPGAPVHLWSCETGAGESGAAFLSALAEGLERPVAAASGKIGAAHLGGTWNLDRGSTAHVSRAMTKATEQSYQHVLANATATIAKDTIVQTAVADTLTVTNTNLIQATDSFDGGAGIDAILIGGAAGVTVDLSAVPPSPTTGFRNYEGLSFDNSSGTSAVTLTASQIATGYIAPALAVTGAAGTQNITVNGATSFSAATWTFASWTSGTDKITINGTASADTITGSSQADTLDGGAGVDTLTGGLGNDTYIIDNAGDIVTENASEGTDLVQASVSYALGANVENLTLTGAAAINGTGNSLANAIIGNSSDNILDGGAGVDTLTGLLGNDTYIIDNAGDNVTENAGEGTDLVQASVSYALGANVENLTLIGAVAINGTGNSLVNTITGNSADNVLDGGTGADTLTGGLGNDTFIIDNAGDIVTENAGEGTDLVQASVSYALGANGENLTLTGAAAINGTGNSLANTIVGNSGNNLLDGGTGADTLIGGLGNDTYIIDNAGDVVTENAGEGADTVQISTSYTIATNLENLTLTGAAAINGTGNALANIIIGNGADNILDGGVGADTLTGGLGNDTYIIDNIADVITENLGEGTDAVQASVSHTLGTNVENLTLTGAAVINGTGNALDNIIVGNGAANVLTGLSGNDTLDGGAGADTLIGGLGNDIYVVDNVGDIITENAGEGTDTVQLSTSYTIASNLENLTLSGAAAINGTGNALDNVIVGNGAANALTGLGGNDTLDGGAGADTLTGGLGNDTYVIDNVGDIITEIAGEGTDTVQISTSYTIASNLENLTLAGAAAINGTGNSLDNFIVGNGAANVLTGLGGNDMLDGGAGADTLTGGLGNDTYIVDDAGDIITENAGEGTDTVQISASYTLSDQFENLTLVGTAGINGYGNGANNTIIGNISDNLLDGGAGADALVGGLGNDTYIVDNVGDVITENAGQGTDTVQISTSYTIATNLENLTLTGAAAINGTGNALDNIIVGNGAANVLTGLGGNDTLDGGAGADTLTGGLGNDTYIVDDAGDVITENAGEGTDTVQISTSYTIATNLENLTLVGTAGINGYGNGANNIIIGNISDNLLDGGAGADTLTGGLGNDTYIIDNIADMITENLGEGTDVVQASVSHTLGANVENLTLTGAAAINGTGDALDNIIVGNGAANVLTGLGGNDTLDGGAGTDTLIGGLGNDIYIVDNVGDIVTENAGEGTDTVQASLTYTLGAQIENLTLLGTLAVNGTGNAVDNTIIGNSAANSLTGLAGNDTLNGGGGIDTLIGGPGNDTYIVDNKSDVVTELAGEGTDTVQSSVTYVLKADIESLVLTGTAAINGTGNAGNNILIGNSGANILSGDVGADSMTGGKGNDTYVVDNVSDVLNEIAGEGTDTVQSSIGFVLAGAFENLTLTGAGVINATGNDLANVLTGNNANNVLTGLQGNDTLNGGVGLDTMIGGIGNDTFVVDNIGDIVTENVGEGTDSVESSVTHTLGATLENLTLTGTAAINGSGNNLINVLIGNSAANTLIGLDGNDTLNGGTGADGLIGGKGDDLYVVDNVSDIITENLGEGTDAVQSSATFTLSANVDNLTLTGSAALNGTGNELNNVIIGNSGVNHLYGLAGNDTLNGGNGGDFLVGGTGDDLYIVDNLADSITEAAGEGTDSVQSTITYTLIANVENLQLTGSSATTGTGNALNNTIVGNSGVNTLYGLDGNDWLDGGSGADKLYGGTGSDTYVVRNVAAVVTENAGEGTDTIISSATFTLSANVENLTLAVGTSSWNATGNADANILTGNAGKNLLDGAAGADQMIGGGGYDTYVVDNAGDTVVENVDQGTDAVRSSVTFTLASNIEYLTLTGSSAINGTGNELANEITGNDAANTLMGGGGEDFIYGGAGDDILIGGALTDTLTGGLGNDTFTFTAVTDSGLDDAGMGPIDYIMDFTAGDHIDLSLIDANLGVAGDQAFTLDVDASFSAGEISVADFSGVSYVTINLDSDSTAEMAFYVQYTGSLTSADFIL